jgi:hypothetical protein
MLREKSFDFGATPLEELSPGLFDHLALSRNDPFGLCGINL